MFPVFFFMVFEQWYILVSMIRLICLDLSCNDECVGLGLQGLRFINLKSNKKKNKVLTRTLKSSLFKIKLFLLTKIKNPSPANQMVH